MCVDNYKKEVASTKCPPAYQYDDKDDVCIVPSADDDIIGITSFVKDIHESIRIRCKNKHCDGSFNVLDINNHEESCVKRGFYKTARKSLATTTSEILLKDTDKAINTLVE